MDPCSSLNIHRHQCALWQSWGWSLASLTTFTSTAHIPHGYAHPNHEKEPKISKKSQHRNIGCGSLWLIALLCSQSRSIRAITPRCSCACAYRHRWNASGGESSCAWAPSMSDQVALNSITTLLHDIHGSITLLGCQPSWPYRI